MCVLGVGKHSCKIRIKKKSYKDALKSIRAGHTEHFSDRNLKTLTLCSIIDAKVSGSVDDDALHGDAEALVQALDAVGLADLHQTVSQAFELALLAGFAHVGSQTGPGKVEGVDEAQRGGPSGTAGGQVAGKVSPELLALVDAVEENLLVLILEGKVEGLGGEVTDHVGQVAPPE